MSNSVDKKPTLECILEDVEYDNIHYESKISLSPYYENLDMAIMITKLIQTIEFSVGDFMLTYGRYRKFIITEYTKEMMDEVNTYFEKIYKLIHLTSETPKSAFRVDTKIYDKIYEENYLEDWDDTNHKTLESIYSQLLEIDVAIQGYKIRIESYFERSK
jgi:hypothetical protein